MFIWRMQSQGFYKCLVGPVSDHVLINRVSKERALYQSALKHGRRTFLYSAIGEQVCSGQLWERAALKQLGSYKVG